MKRRVVVGISGASGAAIGVRAVEILAGMGDVEVHLVLTHAAEATLLHEVGPLAASAVAARAHVVHGIDDVGDSIASGSFRTAGMIVAPCSMRTLGAIVHGLAEDLLTRAADVHLKERRRLILVARETPLHLGHLRNMVSATEMGAIIAPPVPAFYRNPATVGDIVNDIALRCVDLLQLGPAPLAGEWGGLGKD